MSNAIHKKNNDYFKNIDTENKAYILGFISADGYLSTKDGNKYLSIELQKRDKKILQFIKKEIQYSGKIATTYHNNKEYCRLKIYGEELVNNIIDKGLDNQKTYNLEFPSSIPPHLIRHYIRGLFDGDGCVYIGKQKRKNGTLKDKRMITLISTKMMNDFICSYIKNKFDIQFRVSYSVTQKNTKMSTLYLEKYNNIKIFLDYLYDDSNIHLERKYNKFLKLQKIKQQNESKIQKQKKLTETQVKEIKKRLNTKTETTRSIAKDFNVSHGVIQSIKIGKCYKNVS